MKNKILIVIGSGLFSVLLIANLILSIIILKQSSKIKSNIYSMSWDISAIDSTVDSISNDISDLQDNIRYIKNTVDDIDSYLQ